jgi:hypothetical protein
MAAIDPIARVEKPKALNHNDAKGEKSPKAAK